jgi:putative hydrolase of the HAD superfamily
VIEAIALDADDTLWHNERLFQTTQQEFRQLLARYHDAAWIDERLYETELRNLEHFGYGVKSFTLSMVETAIELTEGRVTGEEVGRIVEMGRTMLSAPVDLLPDVPAVIDALSHEWHLLLITKGDLLDQEGKLERSGLRARFRGVHVVSHKDAATYRRVLARDGIDPARFVMVGDSLRSDVLPILELGGWAMHIPQPNAWLHETGTAGQPESERYARLGSIAELPDRIRRIAQRGR